MKKYLLLTSLLVPAICFAHGVGYNQYYEGQPTYSYGQLVGPGIAPGLANADANPGFNIANPGRRRVAGAAIIMQSEGMINEDSIPYYALNKEPYEKPENSIFVGTVEPIPAGDYILPEPTAEKHGIIEQTTVQTDIVK